MSINNKGLLSRAEVCRLLPFAASSYWFKTRTASGEFPSPTRDPDGRLMYVRAEVEKWIATYLAEFEKKKEAESAKRKTTVETAKDTAAPDSSRPKKSRRV